MKKHIVSTAAAMAVTALMAFQPMTAFAAVSNCPGNSGCYSSGCYSNSCAALAVRQMAADKAKLHAEQTCR